MPLREELRLWTYTTRLSCTLRSTYRGEWRPPVGEFKEPLLAPASAKLLTLGDVVADELDAEMNELTE